ncbi:MAG: ABC transporter ATP-binding protein [Anaerolineae bacterium]|nr:ABC transporter ATP-binding protein [Phycisphaerae bacterium]
MIDPGTTQTTAGIALRLRGVRRVFDDDVVAVDHMDLDVPAGQFLAMLGPSGCGKSTLLRIIAGLDRPSAGTIDQIDRSSIAYVFQDAHLLPWRNVLRNVALPLELRGVGKRERLAAARAAIAQVGLADAERRYPSQLSGGMRMRVSLARALVTRPRLLLLDEPFAALDEITRQQLDEQLRALWLQQGMTVVFVTHSIVEAAFLADRAIILTKRPARIVLDHDLSNSLPIDRTNAIRGEPAFARETRTMFEALQRGGANEVR